MSLRPTQQYTMPGPSKLPGVSEVMDLGGDSIDVISDSENELHRITDAHSRSIVKVGRAGGHGRVLQKEKWWGKGRGNGESLLLKCMRTESMQSRSTFSQTTY